MLEGLVSFEVCMELYSVENPKSNIGEIDELIASNEAKDGGLIVNLVENDSFTYNRLIDVSNADLNTPLCTIFPHTYSLKYSDSINAQSILIEALDFVVRLTDYFDPSNYIEIHGRWVESNPSTHRFHPYIQAKSGTQPSCGLQLGNYASKSTRRLVSIDGEQMTAYFGLSEFGTNVDGKWINGKYYTKEQLEKMKKNNGYEL